MIHRRDFLKLCAAVGLGALVGCAEEGGAFEPLEGRYDGRVVIVGAGAAGMTAAYLLSARGADVRVLEAASTHGGRLKRDVGFVDFPIPLGAEWLHGPASLLAAIVDDPSVTVTTRMRSYDPSDLSACFEDGELTTEPIGRFEDLKFVGSSWLDFFDAYIVPSIAARMTFNAEVVEVDHSGDGVVLTDASGARWEADVALITVPLGRLRDGAVRFVPPLSGDKREALDEAIAMSGLKVFVAFAERFYPPYLKLASADTRQGEMAYYDAAYGQASAANVLGLFAVGSAAARYLGHTDAALRDLILAELDAVFEGAASRHYLKHIVQIWDDEPFVGQAYLYDRSEAWIPPALFEPIGDRLFFAGEAYTQHDDWGSVHDAARAAREVVAMLLE